MHCQHLSNLFTVNASGINEERITTVLVMCAKECKGRRKEFGEFLSASVFLYLM